MERRTDPPRVAVEPAGSRPWLGDAVARAGAAVVPPAEAEALVWASPADPGGLADLLAGHPHIRWVQLPWAGVEPYRELLDGDRTWTCGKGVYAEPVAEMALALLLAGLRGIGAYARRRSWDRTDADALGANLLGARVVVVGGGGITRSLLRLLGPFGAEVSVVRRRPSLDDLPGAAAVVGPDRLHELLPHADAVVLALARVPDTEGLIGAAALDRMASHAWLVNVARGAHVVTDDLVAALARGAIGGAALDVTDPEPLPDGHPLWSEPRCIVTPHVANTDAMAVPLLAARVTDNVRRYAAGEPLVGLVDAGLGY